MEGGGIKKLTDGQKACLRCVLRHMSSKDIARELGISPHTVDQRIRLAMRALNAGSRVQAAFMLAKQEGGSEYQSPIYQAPDIAPPRLQRTIAPSEDGWRQNDGELLEAVREEQAPWAMALPYPDQRLRLPIPGWGGRPHDLGPWQRLGWIFALALTIALTFGIFLTGLEALGKLAGAIS
jgi:DNA-binding CsgD family transcriptional regulator